MRENGLHAFHGDRIRHTPVVKPAALIPNLIGGGKGLGDLRFGGEIKNTLQQRADSLAEQGLAERRG